MRPIQAILAWLAALGILGCARGHPSGAPVEACDTMVPRHEGAKVMDGAAGPYVVEVEKQRPQSSKLKFILRGGTFKGFLLQVKEVNGPGSPAGIFAEDNSTYSVRDCPDSRGEELFRSAVTHVTSAKKSHLEIQWNPPVTSPLGTKFVIVVTVVEAFDTIFTNITKPFKL